MMLMNAALLLLLLFVVSIMGESSSSRRSSSSESESIESLVYGGCSRQKYTPNSPYQSNVDSLLTSAVNSAAYSSYNNYTITHHQVEDVVYGLYQCRGDLSLAECATCVSRAVAQMSTLCSGTCGGAVQLQCCYLKYDNATFLGVEDKTLVLKNCGPSSVGVEEDSWVDAVLTTLSSSSGQQDYYRAGASGEVQGVSQCVADLTVGECQDCVSEAIARLRTDCGTSIYGHVYLAKCYVQYSATSAGLNNPNVVDNNNYPPHDDYNIDGKSSNDEGAKTFAIIIGLLAGVGLLIIFLAFIRKVVAEGHTSDETGK